MLNDDIEVSVIPNVGLGSMMTEKTLVPFSSAFKLVSSSNIQLTNVDPQSEIVITGKFTKSISRNLFLKFICTFLLLGLNNVLVSIEITPNDPHYLYVGRPYTKSEDSMAWSIGLKASFWSEAKPGTELSVLVSSPSVTGQNVIIPIKVNFRGDQCANIEMGWSVLLYFLAAHYQSLIFILASCVICVFITKLMLQNTANAGKSDSSAKPPMERNQNFLNVSPSAMKIHQNGYASPMTSEARPHLWTVNDSPVYGSPTSTSPYNNRKSPRSLTQTQYSYDR